MKSLGYNVLKDLFGIYVEKRLRKWQGIRNYSKNSANSRVDGVRANAVGEVTRNNHTSIRFAKKSL